MKAILLTLAVLVGTGAAAHDRGQGRGDYGQGDFEQGQDQDQGKGQDQDYGDDSIDASLFSKQIEVEPDISDIQIVSLLPERIIVDTKRVDTPDCSNSSDDTGSPRCGKLVGVTYMDVYQATIQYYSSAQARKHHFESDDDAYGIQEEDKYFTVKVNFLPSELVTYASALPRSKADLFGNAAAWEHNRLLANRILSVSAMRTEELVPSIDYDHSIICSPPEHDDGIPSDISCRDERIVYKSVPIEKFFLTVLPR